MNELPDWTIWVLAATVCALLVLFFWHTASIMLEAVRHLIGTIQNWPQIRRAMVEAEVRAGGRYPLWFRLGRMFLILAMIGLMVLLVWRKFA
jgi:type VI protein secretion system component VasF